MSVIAHFDDESESKHPELVPEPVYFTNLSVASESRIEEFNKRKRNTCAIVTVATGRNSCGGKDVCIAFGIAGDQRQEDTVKDEIYTNYVSLNLQPQNTKYFKTGGFKMKNNVFTRDMWQALWREMKWDMEYFLTIFGTESGLLFLNQYCCGTPDKSKNPNMVETSAHFAQVVNLILRNAQTSCGEKELVLTASVQDYSTVNYLLQQRGYLELSTSMTTPQTICFVDLPSLMRSALVIDVTDGWEVLQEAFMNWATSNSLLTLLPLLRGSIENKAHRNLVYYFHCIEMLKEKKKRSREE